MADKGDGRDAILRDVHVIDGGLATELEYQGARVEGPLWSAHVLEDEPDKLVAVHRAYIAAGAECLATCSYQVSRMGYAQVGLTAERADAALLRSVELARSAIAEFPERRVVAAGSLGPYGAALHNGGEYQGDYDCSFDDLVRFHRERIEVFAGATGPQRPDLLAFETFPSLEEVCAVGEALANWPELQAWFSFSCRDEKHVSHGERVADCAALVASFPQTVAVGVNCVPPKWIPSLIDELRKGSDKPVLVYPNSGEGWNAEQRCWIGTTDAAEFGARAAEWFHAGAQIVGGCCRTRPEHIAEVAQAAKQLGAD
ncbi:MAG: homocysteine S-methyltransferase [Terracidiphilus sp.]|jgi:homocysteine S-methyltransferase